MVKFKRDGLVGTEEHTIKGTVACCIKSGTYPVNFIYDVTIDEVWFKAFDKEVLPYYEQLKEKVIRLCKEYLKWEE